MKNRIYWILASFGAIVILSSFYSLVYNGLTEQQLQISNSDISTHTQLPQHTRVVPSTSVATTAQFISQGTDTSANQQQASAKFLVPLLNPAFAVNSTQNSVTSTEWAVPTSASGPSGISPGPAGIVFFTEASGNKIGRLVPSTNVITEWLVPTGGGDPWSVAVGPLGKAVFFGENNNKIGRLAPSTNIITEWATVDTVGNQAVSVNASSGNVFFAGADQAKDLANVGRLDPITNEFTIWTPPSSVIAPKGVAVGPSGKVFFTESSGTRIDSLAVSTNVITQWTVPSGGAAGVAVDSAGNVFFAEGSGNKIARLVPSSNTITEWTVPTASSSPKGISVDTSGNVFFTESSADKIGRLVPSTNVITEWTLPNGSTSGYGITLDSSGNIFFTENSVNKIGRLG